MDREAIRSEVLAKRSKLDDNERALRSEEIRKKLSDFSLYKDADFVLCYASYNKEVDTFSIIKMAIEDGKAVYCPRVIGRNMVFLRVYAVEELQLSDKGIPEPFLSEVFTPSIGAKKGLCIMPGVAFDRNRNRLGYGGGFYDRYLGIHKEFVNTVALAFSMQIIDEIATEPHDIKPEAIITNKEIIM